MFIEFSKCRDIIHAMELQAKVASLFNQIAQLPEHAQVEVVEALVSMRCAQLGIYPADDETQSSVAV